MSNADSENRPFANLYKNPNEFPVRGAAPVSGQGAMTDKQITEWAMYTMDHADLGKGDDTTNTYQFSHSNLKLFAQKVLDSRTRSEDKESLPVLYARQLDIDRLTLGKDEKVVVWSKADDVWNVPLYTLNRG